MSVDVKVKEAILSAIIEGCKEAFKVIDKQNLNSEKKINDFYDECIKEAKNCFEGGASNNPESSKFYEKNQKEFEGFINQERIIALERLKSNNLEKVLYAVGGFVLGAIVTSLLK